jgi:hypothetical protein
MYWRMETNCDLRLDDSAGDYRFAETRFESVKRTLAEFKAGLRPLRFGSLFLKPQAVK